MLPPQGSLPPFGVSLRSERGPPGPGEGQETHRSSPLLVCAIWFPVLSAGQTSFIRKAPIRSQEACLITSPPPCVTMSKSPRSLGLGSLTNLFRAPREGTLCKRACGLMALFLRFLLALKRNPAFPPVVLWTLIVDVPIASVLLLSVSLPLSSVSAHSYGEENTSLRQSEE